MGVKAFVIVALSCLLSCVAVDTGEFNVAYKAIADAELCGEMCSHLRRLATSGDDTCLSYVKQTQDGTGAVYECETLCVYKTLHGVDPRTRCVIDKVRNCAKDAWVLCGI